MPLKLLILEPNNYPESAIQMLKNSGYEVEYWDSNAPTNYYIDVSVLMVRLGYYIDSEFVSQFVQLKTIITPTTGVTHISQDVRERLTIIKIDPEDSYIGEITPTAEHAILLALMAQRNIKQIFQNINDNFSRPSSSYGSLKQAKVLIFGHGRIGAHVARLIKPFTQIDPDTYDIIPERCSISEADLKNKICSYNLIFICTKFTGEIQIDKEFIRKIGKKSILINIARGELVDEVAILNKLKNNLDFYYCTDVLTDEHVYRNNILYNGKDEHENLILTPHIGGFCINSLNFIEWNIVAKFLNKNLCNV